MDIDIHRDGEWHACARIVLRDSAKRSVEAPTTLCYDADYALENLWRADFRALGVRQSVDLSVRHAIGWPSFLCDLLPQGWSRTELERSFEGSADDWTLLESAAANPVGNLRVRPQQPRPRSTHSGFDLATLVSRGAAAMQFAASAGAAIVGATELAGESPKCALVETVEGRWLPDDGRLGARARRFALLKFPAPQSGPLAATLLRNEAAYQRVALRLGLDAVQPVDCEGALLVPRFDRRVGAQGEIRLGVESLASVAGRRVDAEPLTHPQALAALCRCVSDFPRDLDEYLRRELLNIALGNRDNGPRNSAVLKDVDGNLRLAPLFDFAPSYLDERRLVRRMRWAAEQSVAMDWNEILRELATHFAALDLDLGDIRMISENMRNFAEIMRNLPDLMHACGVDGEIIEQRRSPIAALCRALNALDPS